MVTYEEKATWKAKLVEEQYVIKGIKTENGDMMKAVYGIIQISVVMIRQLTLMMMVMTLTTTLTRI